MSKINGKNNETSNVEQSHISKKKPKRKHGDLSPVTEKDLKHTSDISRFLVRSIFLVIPLRSNELNSFR